MLEVEMSGLGDGLWVARYDRWEVCRECPIEAVASVLEYEADSLRESLYPGFTRDDDHSVANAFRAVCVEQLGWVPSFACYVRDDTDADVMEIRIRMATGVGPIELDPFKIEGAAGVTDDAWYSDIRREMRRWFKNYRKGTR